MPFKSEAKVRLCKYCEEPAKVHYHGIKRLHKGYYRTCGSEVCLRRQYNDHAVNQKKAYVSRGITKPCDSCGKEFVKTNNTSRWCSECVPTSAARERMMRYGISESQYQALFVRSDGLCPICLKNRATVIDHDHKTNRVRGLICQHCNTSLHVIENPEHLQRALDYLNQNTS